MLESLLCSDALSRIVGKQTVKEINKFFGPVGKQFFESHSFLLWKVELVLAHVSGSALEQIYKRLFGCAEDLVDFMNLI